MAVQGIFLSNQGIVVERQGDFASAIIMTQPTGTAPYLAMSSGMKKEATQDTVFTCYKDASTEKSSVGKESVCTYSTRWAPSDERQITKIYMKHKLTDHAKNY